MSTTPGGLASSETSPGAGGGVVTARYWAAARAAAGVAEDAFDVPGPLTLAEVVERVLAAHPQPRMAQVIGVCAAVIGDRPVASADPTDVVVQPGETVEFLPPFAGG